MGKQRAKRRQQFYAQAYWKILKAAPEDGFRGPIEARMGVPIIARQARFRCACGRLYVNGASWSWAVAHVCGECGAIYRVEGGFDPRAFRARPDPRYADWWPIGEMVRLRHLPDDALLPVPRRLLGKLSCSTRIG